jgi:DNA invertase Pin-like site-specific DNA recombinase
VPVSSAPSPELRKGDADVLVVAKLDRLARSSLGFANVLHRAETNGWSLAILELGLDTGTAVGKFTASIVAAVAELERSMISSRTKQALAAAQARGTKLGRKPNLPPDVLAQVQALRASGLSLANVAERMKALGIPSASGAPWTFSSVRSVLARQPQEAAA